MLDSAAPYRRSLRKGQTALTGKLVRLQEGESTETFPTAASGLATASGLGSSPRRNSGNGLQIGPSAAPGFGQLIALPGYADLSSRTFPVLGVTGSAGGMRVLLSLAHLARSQRWPAGAEVRG